MTILSDIPDANKPVLSAVSSAGTDNVKLARRAVDEAISDISPYLTDAEVAEAADALHTMVNRWRDQRTA